VTDFDPEQQGDAAVDVGSQEDGGRDVGENSQCRRDGERKRNNNLVAVAEEVKKEQDIVIISQHEVVHHGHSHAHSHLHYAPKNISSVAGW
jgi:hypothetical protein